MADAAPPLQFQTCHLASRHHRVNTPFQGHGEGKLEGRQLHHVKGPGSGNCHPSSTPECPHPEPQHRLRTGAARTLVLSAGPSPSPGLKRLHQHNKTPGGLWPSLAALPAAPGPRDLSFVPPNRRPARQRAGRGGRRKPARVGIKLQAVRGGECGPSLEPGVEEGPESPSR